MVYLAMLFLSIEILFIIFESWIVYDLLSYRFRNFKFEINMGKFASNKQLKELLKLLDDESVEYHACEKRINIYAYKWQFIPMLLARIFFTRLTGNYELRKISVDIIKNKEKLYFGVYCNKNNFVEIYEFNIRLAEKQNKIIGRKRMIKVLFHEYRHKYQFSINMKLSDKELEEDAERFADKFYDKNEHKINQIFTNK